MRKALSGTFLRGTDGQEERQSVGVSDCKEVNYWRRASLTQEAAAGSLPPVPSPLHQPHCLHTQHYRQVWAPDCCAGSNASLVVNKVGQRVCTSVPRTRVPEASHNSAPGCPEDT